MPSLLHSCISVSASAVSAPVFVPVLFNLSISVYRAQRATGHQDRGVNFLEAYAFPDLRTGDIVSVWHPPDSGTVDLCPLCPWLGHGHPEEIQDTVVSSVRARVNSPPECSVSSKRARPLELTIFPRAFYVFTFGSRLERAPSPSRVGAPGLVARSILDGIGSGNGVA